MTRRGEEEKRRKRRGRKDEERKGPRKEENVVLIGERKNIYKVRGYRCTAGDKERKDKGTG